MRTFSFPFRSLPVAMLLMSACGNGRASEGTSHQERSRAVSNADAAHFCKALPPGERGKCVSDAAHGVGLFTECAGNIGLLCGVGIANQTPFCCAAGQNCCAGNNCTDLQTDALNCGVCGNACPSGFCAQGACC